jgi:hypothetical protein
MDLLIVGAGAVGSSYGYFATQAGAKVTYLIKPKHRADLVGGIQLYPWKGRKAEPVLFRDFSLIESGAELRSRKFDAVLITLPSDKFRADGWFAGFLPDFDASSPEAKIWSLQPDANDQNFLASILGPKTSERVVRGSIPLMSYLAPLPGEPFEKAGYAFYTPPTTKAGWSSKNNAAAAEAAKLFDAGGLPSAVVDGTPTSGSLLPEALLRAVVAGLERSEWSYDRLVNSENIHLVTGGMREMTAIAAKIGKVADPCQKWWGKVGSSAFGVKTAMRLARKFLPFDFEAFMRVHFSKVDGQMHLTLDEQIAYGKKNGLSTTNLVLLRGRKRQNNAVS